MAEQSRAHLVNRQVAEFVQEEQGGSGVFLQFRFETTRILGRGQGIDDINGAGKEDRVALEAGSIA